MTEIRIEHEGRYLFPMGVQGIPLGGAWTDQKQGYLCIGDWGEERIRSVTDPAGNILHYHTFKGKGVSSRPEWPPEDPRDAIPDWLAEVLWARKLEGYPILKRRYPISVGNLVVEVDVYGTFLGLVTAEIEVPRAADLDNLIVPEWMRDCVDLTNRPDMKNNKLAIYGPPDDVVQTVLQASGITIRRV